MNDFWRGKRVLLTGHTGFKGAWASLWLEALGAKVTGLALEPSSHPNLYSLIKDRTESVIADIRNFSIVQRIVSQVRPQIVLHMAAQALVRESYRDPVGTFATNVMGTLNLLEACRTQRDLAAILVITSDKVYENDGLGRAFCEQDKLGGHDPYSTSKACTELVTQSYRSSFFADGIPIATARAGNVIGGGDWSVDRLVPDCVRALMETRPVELRYPDATRPWQHVIEALAGYLNFVEALVRDPNHTPRALNFGPDQNSARPVCWVVEAFSTQFAGMPGWRRAPGIHASEAPTLTLNSELAIRSLNWRPKLCISDAISWTSDWYRAYLEGADMVAFSVAQLGRYEAIT